MKNWRENFLSQSCSVANAKPITFRHSDENRSKQSYKLNSQFLYFKLKKNQQNWRGEGPGADTGTGTSSFTFSPRGIVQVSY